MRSVGFQVIASRRFLGSAFLYNGVKNMISSDVPMRNSNGKVPHLKQCSKEVARDVRSGTRFFWTISIGLI